MAQNWFWTSQHSKTTHSLAGAGPTQQRVRGSLLGNISGSCFTTPKSWSRGPLFSIERPSLVVSPFLTPCLVVPPAWHWQEVLSDLSEKLKLNPFRYRYEHEASQWLFESCGFQNEWGDLNIVFILIDYIKWSFCHCHLSCPKPANPILLRGLGCRGRHSAARSGILCDEQVSAKPWGQAGQSLGMSISWL